MLASAAHIQFSWQEQRTAYAAEISETNMEYIQWILLTFQKGSLKFLNSYIFVGMGEIRWHICSHIIVFLERAHMGGGGREAGKEKGKRIQAGEPSMGLDLMSLRSWPEPKLTSNA